MNRKVKQFKFHQYQQNKQPPLISNHKTRNEQRHMVLDIQVLDWYRHKMWRSWTG